jgi:enamine deaminase RidA (YjgF/YER057c/UK114 family)
VQRRVINPWNWQEDQGWTWGIEVTGPFRILHTAGLVPVGADGRLLHRGDVRGQTVAALDNLEIVLTAAGHALGDVVCVDVYTTRPDELTENWDVISSRLLPAGCRAGGVVLGVDRLAAPDLLVQVRAVSIRTGAAREIRSCRRPDEEPPASARVHPPAHQAVGRTAGPSRRN